MDSPAWQTPALAFSSSLLFSRSARAEENPSPSCGAQPELDLLMPRRQPKFRAEAASPASLPRRGERAVV